MDNPVGATYIIAGVDQTAIHIKFHERHLDPKRQKSKHLPIFCMYANIKIVFGFWKT